MSTIHTSDHVTAEITANIVTKNCVDWNNLGRRYLDLWAVLRGRNKELSERESDLAASRKQVAELTASEAKLSEELTSAKAFMKDDGERTDLIMLTNSKTFDLLASDYKEATARITALEAALNEARGVAGGALINFSPDLNPNGCWLLRDSIAIMDAALAPASAPTETEKET